MWVISAIDEFSFQGSVEANRLRPEFCFFLPADMDVRRTIIQYIRDNQIIIQGILGCFLPEELVDLGVA